MIPQTEKSSSAPAPWGVIPPSVTPFLRELPIIFAVVATFYGLLSFTRYGVGPVTTQAEIRLDPGVLPKYAAFSLIRIAIAYFISLIFTFIYGYFAAYNQRAERFMIPLLDTLQSIPVLSFLPPVMVSMVALFPTRQLGLEMGCIVLIVTGQVWNMTFSFYSSLKAIPNEMRDAAKIYRLSWWQRFTQVELPYAAIGLIWNSMMSVAGAWFFLMACEMFVLGNRDLRLPGLGSFLQTAANAGDTRAILWGLAAMVTVIVLTDLVIWRPAIAWAEKFKFEQVEAAVTPRSPVLDLLRRSRFISHVGRVTVQPLQEALSLHFARAGASPSPRYLGRKLGKWMLRMLLAGCLLGVVYAVMRTIGILVALSQPDIREILVGAGATLLRVGAALLLGASWTIPVGLYIGLRPKLSALAQPMAQIAASIPATALFPIVLLLLLRQRGGMGIASIVLLLLGTQWYILFNVVAGASAIPTDLKEVCGVFRLGKRERWRKLLLPGIFPYLITGLITASGGAWNASIVAEYFHFRGQTYSVVGLGAAISQATDNGNFRVLLAATVFLAAMVVAINRLVWRRLYNLASTRFKLES